MLTPSLGEHAEHLRGDARVRAHAGADDRDLAHLLVRRHLVEGVAGERFERGARRAQVLARDREGDLRAAAGRRGLVLHDHVDVDVRVGERLEDPRGRAGLVGHAEQRDARLGRSSASRL